MRGPYIVRFLISHTLRTIYNGLLSTMHMQSIVSGEVGYLQQTIPRSATGAKPRLPRAWSKRTARRSRIAQRWKPKLTWMLRVKMCSSVMRCMASTSRTCQLPRGPRALPPAMCRPPILGRRQAKHMVTLNPKPDRSLITPGLYSGFRLYIIVQIESSRVQSVRV